MPLRMIHYCEVSGLEPFSVLVPSSTSLARIEKDILQITMKALIFSMQKTIGAYRKALAQKTATDLSIVD